MDQANEWIISEYIHEPFLMFLSGYLLYFAVVWKRGRNAGRWDGWKPFWHDQKDELAISMISGLIFITWDTQILNALDFCLKYLNLRSEDADPIRMQTFYYFLVSPAVETLGGLIDKLQRK